MKFINVKQYGKDGLWTIETAGNLISSISHQTKTITENNAFDAQGRIVLPPYVEPHIHLDYVLTAGQPRWNESGTLFEGIQCWSERKLVIKESKDDIIKRALQALKMQASHGIQFVRTHVDTTDPELTGFRAMLELKEEVKEWMDIQIVAFPQEGIYAYPNGLQLLEQAVQMGADVIGAIPHYEHTREDGVASIVAVMELAVKYNKLVDVHCDEIDDEQSRFLETVASEALKHGIGHRVTASHTTAMGSYNDAYTYKLFRLLRNAGIHFVALPKANLHLQGRFDSYPKRRGLTRVKELLESKINVCFGLDSIMDPWYPLGDGNLMPVLDVGIHACQLTGYQNIMTALHLITTNGAKTLDIENRYGIEVNKPANLIIIDATDDYDAVRCQASVILSVRNGNILMEATPRLATFKVDYELLE